MVCFWKWGHRWSKPSEKLEKDIKETLNFIGIYPCRIDVCSKCKKVKVTATTCLDTKPKTFILPPYPSKE